MQYARLTVNLEEAQVQALNAMARAAGLPTSVLVRQVIQQFLTRKNRSIRLPSVNTDNMRSADSQTAQERIPA